MSKGGVKQDVGVKVAVLVVITAVVVATAAAAAAGAVEIKRCCCGIQLAIIIWGLWLFVVGNNNDGC